MQTPYGADPWGSGITWSSANVVGWIRLIDGWVWLTTQIVPSAAWASVRGFLPTGISVTALVEVRMDDTVSWSGLTTHTRPFVESRRMVDELVGLTAVSGQWTTSLNCRVTGPAPGPTSVTVTAML